MRVLLLVAGKVVLRVAPPCVQERRRTERRARARVRRRKEAVLRLHRSLSRVSQGLPTFK